MDPTPSEAEAAFLWPRALHGVALAGILIAAIALRLRHLTTESAWLDEIFSIRFVAERNLWQVIHDSFTCDFHPPSYYALLDVWLSVFGHSDGPARVLSVLLGGVGLYTAGRFAQTAFRDKRVGVICTALLAISPTHVYFSREARMYVLMLLAWPWFLECLCRAWQTGYSRRASCVLILAFTVFSYAHATSGLFALPVLAGVSAIAAVRFLFQGCRRGALRASLTAAAGTAIYLPWLLRLLHLQESAKTLGRFRWAATDELLGWLVFLNTEPSAVHTVLGWLVAGSLFIVLLHPRQSWRTILRPAGSVVTSIGLVLLLQVVLSRSKPCFQERNLVFLLPPIFALAGGVMVGVWNVSWKPESPRFARFPGLVIIAALLLCLGNSMLQATRVHIARGYGKEAWREAFNVLAPRMQHGDVIAFYAGFMRQCWDHYAVGYDPVSHGSAAPGPSDTTFEIPRTPNPSAFTAAAKRMIAAATAVAPGSNSLWVFYSHVGDAGRLHSQIEAASLLQVETWYGHGIEVKRYCATPPSNEINGYRAAD